MEYKYLVLELFPTPHLVTDKEGIVKNYLYLEDAMSETQECQEGIVIDLENITLWDKKQSWFYLISTP